VLTQYGKPQNGFIGTSKKYQAIPKSFHFIILTILMEKWKKNRQSRALGFSSMM
jgi:hypothetical protein